MIKLAKEEEKNNPLEIKYHEGDATSLKHFGNFDLVTAGFLLHYSKDKNEIKKMCEGAYKNLRAGGKFITLNTNPKFPVLENKKYGITVRKEKADLKEGDKLIVTLLPEDGKRVSFETYYWSKETYEKCLREAGFRNIEWIQLKVSEEGIKKFGKEFWKNLIEEPYLVIIKAGK